MPATLLAILPLALASCGYTSGTGLHQYDIHTIAFQVVGNNSYRQRLEVEISRRLARDLALTDLTLADRKSADATLVVVLDEVRERSLVGGLPGPVNAPRTGEGALEAAVTMRLIARDGSVRLEQVLFDRSEFRALIGENLTSARAELAEDLARKIVLALQTDF